MIRTVKKYILRLCRATGGNVVIELALVMSVLMLLGLVGYDVSRMAAEDHQLEQIARSAAQWGLVSQGNAKDTAQVEEKAVEAAGDDGPLITATAATVCICPDGTEIDCDEVCTDDEPSEMYLKVEVTKPFDFSFNLSAFLGEFTLRGYAEFRVR